MAHSARFWIIQCLGIGGLFVAYRLGWVNLTLESDRSGISLFIFGMFIVGCCFACWGNRHVHDGKTGFDKADWVRRRLVVFGFVGTLVGFIIALNGVNPEAANNVEMLRPMIAQLISGMGTALFTTLIGLLTSEWLGFLIEWFDKREEE